MNSFHMLFLLYLILSFTLLIFYLYFLKIIAHDSYQEGDLLSKPGDQVHTCHHTMEEAYTLGSPDPEPLPYGGRP